MIRPYQEDAARRLHTTKRAILAFPPGTGKTATISHWLAGEMAGPILVVAPNGPVLTHWKSELSRWGDILAGVCTGPPTRRAAARKCMSPSGNLQCLVISYELMRRDIDELLQIPWGAVVFDESHRLKNRSSQTFRHAAKLARRIPRVALVTGTPILNRADELWTSLHILEPERYKSFWTWARYHFIIERRRFGGRLVELVGPLKKGHAEMLRAELGEHYIHGSIEELLPDLPEVTETYLTVQLSAKERKAYDSLLADQWAMMGNELVVVENEISKSTRLRQLASDWTVFGEPELGAKGQAACELIEDLDPEQVVVFCAYRSTVDAIAHQFHDVAVIHGGVSGADRDARIHAFKHGHVSLLVGTLATMGEGIDGLQVARHAIFVDRDWTPARNTQAVGRLRRNGQRNGVNVYHLVAEETIDQAVAEALQRKTSVIKAVLHCHTRRVRSHAQ